MGVSLRVGKRKHKKIKISKCTVMAKCDCVVVDSMVCIHFLLLLFHFSNSFRVCIDCSIRG